MTQPPSLAKKIADQLAAAEKPWVALTGAGISTESGLPDFRSTSGLWNSTTPVSYAEFRRNPEARFAYWQQKSEMQDAYESALPNRGHLILADWEKERRLGGVMTQNIDGLHQGAGSSVLELHGSIHQIGCLDCDFQDAAVGWVERFRREGTVPGCPLCGAPLKHATISFGQFLSPGVLQEAWKWSRQAAGIIVVGTSLTVRPAAELPRVAKQSGGGLIIINRDPTPLDHTADIVVRGEAGETLACIQDYLQRGRPSTGI